MKKIRLLYDQLQPVLVLCLAGENLYGSFPFPLPGYIASMIVVVHEQIEHPLSHVILCGIEIQEELRHKPANGLYFLIDTPVVQFAHQIEGCVDGGFGGLLPLIRFSISIA